MKLKWLQFFGGRFQRRNRSTSTRCTVSLERNWRPHAMYMLYISAAGCSGHTGVPVLPDINKCSLLYMLQKKDLQCLLPQAFWKANHGNCVPCNQQMTSTMGCVYDKTDRRLAVSINALCATHITSENDICLILRFLLCLQYLCSN